MMNRLKRFQEIFVSQLKHTKKNSSNHIWIHKNNWQSSLEIALTDHYPYLLKLIGESCFYSLAREFIESNPSHEADLGKYGARFPKFMATQALIKDYPYLTDIADFEWQCNSLMNHLAEPFLWHKLQTIDAQFYDQLCFTKNNNCALFTSNFSMLDILAFCEQNTHQQSLNLQTKKHYYLLKAMVHQIKTTPLSQSDYIFLNSLFAGNPISKALNAVGSFTTHFNLEVKLPHWLTADIFSDCYLTNSSL